MIFEAMDLPLKQSTYKIRSFFGDFLQLSNYLCKEIQSKVNRTFLQLHIFVTELVISTFLNTSNSSEFFVPDEQFSSSIM